MKYVFVTNLDGLIKVIRELDVFIINWIIGASAVAIYKIARTFSKMMGKITGSFFQAIYPELARMVAKKEYSSIKSVMLASSLPLGTITSILWLMFLVFGRQLLTNVFGQTYSQSYIISLWCIAAMAVWGFAQPLSPAMMAFGKPKISMMVHLITTLAYASMLIVFVSRFGLDAAGFCLFAFYVLWSLLMYFAFNREFTIKLLKESPKLIRP